MDASQIHAQQMLDRWAKGQPENVRSAVMTSREILEEIRLAHHNIVVRAPRVDGDRDQEYKLLYDACVVAGNALMHAYGYRASGAGGHRAAVTAAVGVLRSLHDEGAAREVQSVSSVLAVKRHEAAYERLHAVDGEDLAFAHALSSSVVPVLCRRAAERLGLDLGSEGITFPGGADDVPKA